MEQETKIRKHIYFYVEGEEADIDQLILFLQNRTYIWIEDMKVKSMPVEGGYGFYVKEDE